MKKNILLFILTIAVAAVAQFFLSWWAIAPVMFVFAFFQNNSHFLSFIYGASVGAVLWGSYGFWLDRGNRSQLSASMGQLIGGLSGLQILLLTIAMAALVGGMGALTGSLLRKMLTSTNRRK